MESILWLLGLSSLAGQWVTLTTLTILGNICKVELDPDSEEEVLSQGAYMIASLVRSVTLLLFGFLFN